MPPALSPGRTTAPSLPSGRSRDRLGRILRLDVARALAVFGMLGAQVGVVAADVGTSPSNWLGVVNGRLSILFAVLLASRWRCCPATPA